MADQDQNQNKDSGDSAGVAVTEAIYQIGEAALNGAVAIAEGAGHCVGAVCECIGDIASGL